MKVASLLSTGTAKAFLGVLAVFIGLVILLVMSDNRPLGAWIAAGVLLVVLVALGYQLNQKRQNSLGSSGFKFRRPKRQKLDVAPPANAPSYGLVASKLSVNAPVRLPDRRAYDETDPAFLQHKDRVTSNRPNRVVVNTVTGRVGGSGKTRTNFHTCHAEIRLGFIGAIAAIELNPNGVYPTVLGRPKSKKNQAQLLEVIKTSKSLSHRVLLNHMECTDFGVAALPLGSVSMTPADVDTVVRVFGQYFGEISFDAENGLTTPAMQRMLWHVKQTGGVVINLITNRIDSHEPAEEAAEYLESIGVKYINVVSETEKETTEDALFKAFEIVDRFKAPIRFIQYVPELRKAALVFWGILDDDAQRTYGELASTRALMIAGVTPDRYPAHKAWAGYVVERERRADNQRRADARLGLVDAPADDQDDDASQGAVTDDELQDYQDMTGGGNETNPDQQTVAADLASRTAQPPAGPSFTGGQSVFDMNAQTDPIGSVDTSSGAAPQGAALPPADPATSPEANSGRRDDDLAPAGAPRRRMGVRLTPADD